MVAGRRVLPMIEIFFAQVADGDGLAPPVAHLAADLEGLPQIATGLVDLVHGAVDRADAVERLALQPPVADVLAEPQRLAVEGDRLVELAVLAVCRAEAAEHGELRLAVAASTGAFQTDFVCTDPVPPMLFEDEQSPQQIGL